MFHLEKNGYKFLAQHGIWSRADYQDISYSDGDYEEQRLAKIIASAKDISIFSSELRNQCIDWQTLYHLSSQRGNILRPFQDKLRGKVLEIGAGCGAITRFLGENGGQILALEGSQRRAAIASSRTRDLDNITVLAERFDDFQTDEKFDAITLIGVLEYASMFSSAEHAANAMLEKIRGFLKPDGFLFIAIENQLGLKYFAGAPEDHLAKPMYGVEGRYKSGEPETYGKVAIEQLLKGSGYHAVEFMAPFPDYKMPTSIITERGCKLSEFDAGAFAWQTVAADPQLPAMLNFSLTDAWPVIFRNNLGMDLANSFLIAATVADYPATDANILAYHYSTQRKPAYVKETIFSSDNAAVNIHYEKLAESAETEQGNYICRIVDKPVYHNGFPFSFKFVTLFTSPEWRIAQVVTLLREYLAHLQLLLAGKGHSTDLHQTIPGEFIDALPQNIIIDNSGQPHLFDCEWAAPKPIETTYLLFRTLNILLRQSARVMLPAENPEITRQEFILQVIRECGFTLNESELNAFNEQEIIFQQQVTGLSKSYLDVWHPDAPLSSGASSFSSEGRLYYRNGEQEFTQLQSSSFNLKFGQTVSHSLDVSVNPNEKHYLRLDPSETSGWILIENLQVKDREGHVQWSLKDGTASYVDLCEVCALEQGVLYYSNSNDPQILIPQVFIGQQITVNVSLQMAAPDVVAQALAERIRSHALTESELSQLQQAQQKLTAELLELKAKVDSQNAQLANYVGHIQVLNSIINDFRESTSWKVSKPLRIAGGVNLKLKKANRLITGLIQKHGMKAVAQKGMYYIRQEGVSGIIARLKQQRSISVLQENLNLNTVPAASISYDNKTGYQLKPGRSGYCYVEPARPVDLAERIAAIESKPFFSIVIPVYNTPLDLLDGLLKSITSQWYPHWELILADDCSPDPQLQQALKNISHPQIRIIHAESNLRISGATNLGIKAAKGDFIVFADHDDELTVDCLYEMALCIEQQQPDFIYSDEDKLTEDGDYTQPHFKPDWSPDTMMSTMFTCHASCVRRSLLEKTGLLRSEFDGCQDWDFVLRVAEHTNRISHIDKILYHWRIIPASVASDIAAKPYVLEASRQVRVDALKRRGLQGTVEPVTEVPGYFRVNYHLTGTPLISIIIPTRDNAEVLRRCIDSLIEKTKYEHYEVIIVDNGSVAETTLAYFSELTSVSRVKVIHHDIPFNFSELNNIGVAASSGDILLFLNDDTEVLMDDWLERMAGYAQLPHIGAVGAKLLYPGTQQIQHAGVLNLQCGPVHAFLRHDSNSPGYFMRNLLEYNWLAVTGACLMIEREKYQKIGGFDESFPIAYNDVDLCFTLSQNGFYNVVCQAVTLYHYESISRGLDLVDPVKQERLFSELRRLYEKHPNFYQYDPFYNVNLAPNGINFDLTA
ncbi:glycosyltransferase [Klebsiella aerogenes]|uniref:glycosyltransferase n=1 Tax=Klebsiella aerogenes TaxID=548 RepID=UPI001C21D625|nr:glycosyltransferase [Klebsiella aerogenes]QXA74619.1 glycosyltransferase [Klebsiella aerogenes]